jgi:long-subunit fatty acid transport protein
MIKRIAFIILFVNILSPPVKSFCQSQERPPHSAPFNLRYFQINHGISGARANSLGGAFIGVADDATAATINPAGLTALTRPETSAHIRLNRTEISEFEGNIEKWNKKKDYANFEVDFSYGDIVIPFKRFTFAGYWDIVINTGNSFEYRQVVTPYLKLPLSLQDMLQGIGNYPGRRTYFDLQVLNIGTAAAYPVPFLPLSVGFSFQLTKLNFRLIEIQYFNASLLEQDFDPNSHISNSAENLYSVRTIDDSDWERSYTFGMLYKVTSNLCMGIVYNMRPELKVESEIFFPAYSIYNSTILPATKEKEIIKFNLPDFYGIGFCYRFTNWLRLSTDIVKIEYSDMLSDSLANFMAINSDSTNSIIPEKASQLKMDDVIELHVGIEYLLPCRNFDFALRGGFYTNPFHLPYAVNDNPTMKALFPKEKDLFYFTFGFGIGVENLKIDASLKLSTQLKEAESIFSLGIRL